jgi:hypothetical protein
MFVIKTLYERAISEAAKRRFKGEVGSEEFLRSFWIGYCDALVRFIVCVLACILMPVPLQRLDDGRSNELEAFRKGVRSVPGCGELWARYMRYSVSVHPQVMVVIGT